MKCSIMALASAFYTERASSYRLPSQGEEEHKKKISELPKKPIRMPGGKLVYLR